jgi:tetraacyldisaccharide 4'-kinase
MKLENFYNKYSKNKVFQIILYLASILFLICYKARLFLYKWNFLKTTKLNGFVVSVGNITSGGTGKTPTVIELAKYFLHKGKKVAVLCRGYKIKDLNKIILVSDGQEILVDYDICGDEPLLIAKKVPSCMVFVGKDRIKSGRTALRLGANVLILDDGFQYIKLARDKNIAIIDCTNPFDNNHLLPLGKLRELPDSLERSDALILSNYNLSSIKENDLKTLNHYTKNKPAGIIHYEIAEFKSLNTKVTKKPKDMEGLKCIIASGIGNPGAFESLLKQTGINIMSHIKYNDHHLYGDEDITKITKEAQKYNVEDVIVTEKDAIKIEEWCQSEPITYWSANIGLYWNTPGYFDNLFGNIEQAVSSQRN